MYIYIARHVCIDNTWKTVRHVCMENIWMFQLEIARHACKKKHKVLGSTLSAESLRIAARLLTQCCAHASGLHAHINRHKPMSSTDTSNTIH